MKNYRCLKEISKKLISEKSARKWTQILDTGMANWSIQYGNILISRGNINIQRNENIQTSRITQRTIG